MEPTYFGEKMNHQENALVVKDNRLIEASYRLDLFEQRVILMAIVQARGKKVVITPESWLAVSAIDYAGVYAVDISTAYKHLKLAADSLLSRQIVLEGIDPQTQQRAILKTHWATHTIYVPQLAQIKLRLSDVVIPYVTNLESHFTSYRLRAIAGMGSAYAIRLYELLIQYQAIGHRRLSLAELRRYLDAHEKSYDRIDNFKRKVIDIAVKQINECSDLSVQYEQIKQGRAIVALNFLINTLDEPINAEPINKKEEWLDHSANSSHSNLLSGLAGLELVMFKQLKKLDPTITETKIRKDAAQQKVSEIFVIQRMIEQFSSGAI
jgi:plasmid replication initiation protein